MYVCVVCVHVPHMVHVYGVHMCENFLGLKTFFSARTLSGAEVNKITVSARVPVHKVTTVHIKFQNLVALDHEMMVWCDDMRW